MTVMTMAEALNDALRVAMADDDVILLGEDIGKLGGVFRVSRGLMDEFGPERVIDTPLTEGGIVGTTVGMAMNGLRPIAEIQFGDFLFPAIDQLVNEAAKMRYRTGGQLSAPMVVRTPVGGGIRGGHYHSQSPEAYLTHTAGLKVVCPSRPKDAKGLLLASVRDPDPVIFLEPKRVYRAVKEDVPEGDYATALGRAEVLRRGEDITCLVWGAMVFEALAAADDAAGDGVSTEVIDLRTLVPLDIEAIERSVKKTGRLCVVHEAPLTGGYGAELVARVAERCFYHLEAPPVRVTGYDTPFPYTHEKAYLPLRGRIAPTLVRTAREAA